MTGVQRRICSKPLTPLNHKLQPRSAEDFTQAMSVLATLRAPIDQFFTDVMVNDPDSAIRAFRLGLLARFRDAMQRVADFSKIEG